MMRAGLGQEGHWETPHFFVLGEFRDNYTRLSLSFSSPEGRAVEQQVFGELSLACLEPTPDFLPRGGESHPRD
jgi:hypothetical protein